LSVLQSLEEKQVDGVVLCSSRLDDGELEAALAHYPSAVLVNRRLEKDGVVGSVLSDDETGGRLATQHLLHSGAKPWDASASSLDAAPAAVGGLPSASAAASDGADCDADEAVGRDRDPRPRCPIPLMGGLLDGNPRCLSDDVQLFRCRLSRRVVPHGKT